MTTTADIDVDHGFGGFATTDYHIANNGYVVFFSGFWATSPKRGKTRHAVSHDTVVAADGGVEVQVNGVPLDELEEKDASSIR